MSVSRTIHTEKIRTLTIKLIEICLLENAKKKIEKKNFFLKKKKVKKIGLDFADITKMRNISSRTYKYLAT